VLIEFATKGQEGAEGLPIMYSRYDYGIERDDTRSFQADAETRISDNKSFNLGIVKVFIVSSPFFCSLSCFSCSDDFSFFLA
jgi:hypothetical protein